MSEHFRLRFDNSNSSHDQLRLFAEPLHNVLPLVNLLSSWLQSLNGLSQIQPEQGADWIQIRFYFQLQPFCLHYEHYSDCYWIDADSQASLVLLSQLAEYLSSTEHNHRLSLP